jgi:glucosylglycerate synthase
MATTNSISTQDTVGEHPPANLLVLAAAMPAEEFEGVLVNLTEAFSAETLIVATQNERAANGNSPLRVVPIPQSSVTWTLKPADFVNAYEIAREHNVRAVVMLGPGANSLSPLALRGLADAVMNASIDLATPHYALPPNTGLINSAIIYPLTRALFAARGRFPLAIDLGLSMRMAERLATAARRTSAVGQDDAILWPVNEAVSAGFTVDEIDAGTRAVPQPSEVDVNAILALVTGSLFADVESKAAVWQRPRRTPPLRRTSTRVAAAGGPADVAHMVEAFRLANANLQEIWSLVLPPHSLVMLKRFSVVEPTAFRIPENLWARVVFDFLIAYKLRTINRGHLMGALIPLYLAWVASHINVTASGTSPETHIESVAAAFEADKPYLVARWRWPDRFNS